MTHTSHNKLCSDEYKQTLRDTHKSMEGRWGATACRLVFQIVPYVLDSGAKTMLDYGSADGKFEYQVRRRNMMPDVEIINYDPGYEDLQDNNIPCDFVLCVDVLEHIEPELIDNVLDDMQRCTLDQGYFRIAMSPAYQILTDGRNAHLIVEDEGWWTPKIEERWEILDSSTTAPQARPHDKTLILHVKKKED